MPRRPPVRPQLGAVPRRDRRLRRDARARRAHRGQPDGPPQALPLPGAGPDRDRGADEGERRLAARDQVLQHGRADDRRARGARAPPRHVGRPGHGAVRPVGGGARTSAPRSSRRAPTSGCARSARGSTRRTRSSRAGSRARCRRSSPATSMKAYREWLPAERLRGAPARSAAASTPTTSRDYYLTPHDLGYWPFVKFDHDFVGREALEKMARADARRKVTLAWNGDDVARAMGTLFDEGRRRAKYIDLPLSNYSTWPNDKVLARRRAWSASRRSPATATTSARCSRWRSSTSTSRSAPRSRSSGARRAAARAKPVVERHVQAEIRAIVSPCPYSEVARTTYAEGWRTKAAV